MNADYFQSFIGKASSAVKNEVEKGAIRKFAEAIGDTNRIYFDEEYARTTRYGRIIAPPTFSRTFDYGHIDGLAYPQEGLIHGEQSFEYFAPIYAGDVVLCSSRLVNAYDKHGKTGTMTFIVFEQSVENQAGELIQRAQSTVIMRG